MVSTTLLCHATLTVVDRRCDAGPNASPFHELHTDCSLSFVRTGSFGLTRRWKRESSRETPGTKLHRTTYHSWFHLGESQAVRQMLGHTRLPDFVGGFGTHQYRPEAAGATRAS